MNTQLESQTTSIDGPEVTRELGDDAFCPVCRELINPHARICLHCKSDLTWKRFLPVGSTSLAILTALIAVSAAIAPNIKKLFELQDSALHATFLVEEAKRRELVFLVANNGNRSGFVKSAEISYSYGKSQDETLRLAFRRKQDGSFLVNPNSAVQVNLEYYDEQTYHDSILKAKSIFSHSYRALFESMLDIDIKRKPAILSKRCDLTISFINSSGSFNEQALKVECVELLFIMKEVLRSASQRD